MKNYVQMAKDQAAKEKEEAIQKALAEEVKRRERESQVLQVTTLLQEGLNQWDGVCGLECRQVGRATYLMRGNRPYISMECRWGHWTDEWSDDCKTDSSGPEVVMTFHDEAFCKVKPTVYEIHSPHNPEGLVDRCMVSVADYLSKLFK